MSARNSYHKVLRTIRGFTPVIAVAAAIGVTAVRHAEAALTQQPIGVTGFNADTIVDAAASTTITSPAHSANATSNQQGTGVVGNGAVYTSSTNVLLSDINDPGSNTTSGSYLGTGYVHNGEVFFQNGWNGLTTGLPANGIVTSVAPNLLAGGHTAFQLGYNGTATDYANKNTAYFATTSAQTLTFVTPVKMASLDFLAAAFLPTGYTSHTQFDVTLNLIDPITGPTTDTITKAITTGPLGDVGGVAATNKALTGI